MNSEWAGVDGGGGVAPSMSGTGQQGAEVLEWWNPDGTTPGGVGGSTVGAYRAIASVGSPWPLAPIVYADTLQNWSNIGTNDLTENNGVVPWAAATGWGFLAASLKSFDTGITASAITWSILVQFSNFVLLGTPSNRYITGASFGGGLSLGTGNRVTNRALYTNGASLLVIPALLTGNLGAVGSTGYRDGVNDGAIPVGPAAAISVFIGALNSGGAAAAWCTADVEAVAIYNVTLTQPQVTARVASMGAL